MRRVGGAGDHIFGKSLTRYGINGYMKLRFFEFCICCGLMAWDWSRRTGMIAA